MERKPGILFDVYMKENWIGGVYYTRSIVYSCILNKYITDKFNLIVVVNAETKVLFESLQEKITLVEISDSNKLIKLAKIYAIVKKYHVKWYYDLPQGKQGNLFKNIGIYWIPDFQHIHYPQFFNQEELDKRRAVFEKIARSNNWLVLSSEDCFNDFKNEYPEYTCKVKVVHFISYLENELEQVTPQMERDVLQKYGLNKKYIYVSNLFWQHKNHIVVFDAIKLLVDNNELSEYQFVFTGELKDYRNTDYYLKLKAILHNQKISERVKILGFIDRAEQLAIMKNAELLVQPSLFEGWGTVVEDAKVLDKTVVLSDIPVHFEQKNDKCIIFEANNPTDLIDKIKFALNNIGVESLSKGLELARKKAFEYSKNLEEIFREIN
jgi:hypothetical protein